MQVARCNGIDITYDERGKGEPLVLAAGIGMQLVGWPEEFLDRLAGHGLRVIVFDHRDAGESTRLSAAGVPPVRKLLLRALLGLKVTAPYTLFDMADDVAGLISALGLERAHLAGVSMGGMVAQATAIAHGARLKSVISMMSHPNKGLATLSEPRAALKLLRPAARSREEAISGQIEFFRLVGSTGFQRDDEVVARSAARSYDRAFHPAGYARHLAAVLATGDMRKGLRQVRVPALVMHGAVDPLIRASHGRETARAIPGAKWRLIEGWGHDLPPGAWDLIAREMAEHVLAHA